MSESDQFFDTPKRLMPCGCSSHGPMRRSAVLLALAHTWHPRRRSRSAAAGSAQTLHNERQGTDRAGLRRKPRCPGSILSVIAAQHVVYAMILESYNCRSGRPGT